MEFSAVTCQLFILPLLWRLLPSAYAKAAERGNLTYIDSELKISLKREFPTECIGVDSADRKDGVKVSLSKCQYKYRELVENQQLVLLENESAGTYRFAFVSDGAVSEFCACAETYSGLKMMPCNDTSKCTFRALKVFREQKILLQQARTGKCLRRSGSSLMMTTCDSDNTAQHFTDCAWDDENCP